MTELMLTEKYRPTTLDEIVGHDPIVRKLSDWADDGSTPHVLFSGPQGTGKTAMTMAFAREIYGDEGWKNSVLEINASDERGIDVIRNKIKDFAQRSSALGADTAYKLVFLDEADSLTSDAQPALRRIMEDYADQTRFFLSCNYQNQIIEPILSRCATFAVTPLSSGQIRAIVERVIDEEGINAQHTAVDIIVENAAGDARQALNLIQASEVDGTITKQSIEPVTSTIDETLIDDLLTLATKGEFKTAMSRTDAELLKQGADPALICSAFLEAVLDRDDEIPPDAMIKMINAIGRADWRMHNGANAHVQLHNLIASLAVARYLSLDVYDREDL